jgi:hypothetical protein
LGNWRKERREKQIPTWRLGAESFLDELPLNLLVLLLINRFDKPAPFRLIDVRGVEFSRLTDRVRLLALCD